MRLDYGKAAPKALKAMLATNGHYFVKMKLSYKPELDGLRAIAVLSVIINHASFNVSNTHFLTGGFIGVDIFFVLSGYFIGRILLNDIIVNGIINFGSFYERRIRRIIPPLLFVVVVISPIALFLLNPSELKEFSQSILAALSFSSNIFFYFIKVEYAADVSLIKPFLHTWSLAVEEQFYIIFPLIILLWFGLTKRSINILFVGLTLVSLLIAIWLVDVSASANFYMLPSRVWELTIGAIIAETELKNRSFKHLFSGFQLPLIGIALISFSFFWFDENTPHPSILTLIPVVGTGLIIAFAAPKSSLVAVLSSRPFVWMGLISYSAYLWHFPIFALGRTLNEDANNYHRLVWIALTLMTSTFSYYFVEKPFRNNAIINSRLLAGSITAVTAIIVLIATSIILIRPDHELMALKNVRYLMDKGGYQEAWMLQREREGETTFSHDDRQKVLIVGNSYATDMYRALKASRLVEKYDFAVVHPSAAHEMRIKFYQINCFELFLTKNDNGCQSTTFNVSKKFDVADIIILGTRWVRNKRLNDLAALEGTLKSLSKANKRVVILSNNLEVERNTLVRPFIKSVGYRRPNQLEIQTLSADTYAYLNQDNIVSRANKKLEGVSKSFDVPFVHRHDLFCEKNLGICEVFTPEGLLLHWDHGHYTINGASYIGKQIDSKGWNTRLEMARIPTIK